MIKLAITGACGRMGSRLVALGKADKEFELIAGIDRPDSSSLHKDAGEVAGIAPLAWLPMCILTVWLIGHEPGPILSGLLGAGLALITIPVVDGATLPLATKSRRYRA